MVKYNENWRGFGYGFDWFRAVISEADAIEKRKKKEAAGITREGGYEGVAPLIPFIYDSIEVHEPYLYCIKDGKITVYSKHFKKATGTDIDIERENENIELEYVKLFTGIKIEYLKYGCFFVRLEEEGGYALYSPKLKQLTEPLFDLRYTREFNGYGYIACGLHKKFGAHIVLNDKGQIVLEENHYNNLYLYGVVCLCEKGYVNLLSGDLICGKGYGSTLKTKDLVFVEISDNCVYKITKTTGEFEVFGVAPEIKPPIEKAPPLPVKKADEPKPKLPIKKADEPKPKLPNRNDPCICGSGKKYKHCCKNEYEKRN